MHLELSFGILAFCFGAVFGSFGSVLASRIPKGESIVRPGSHCESCGHNLTWWQNLPIISYLVLRGRCGKCGVKYGATYFIGEVVTGLLFVGSYVLLAGEAAFAAIGLLALAVVTFPLIVIDREHHRLPNPLTYSLASAGAVGLAGQLWVVGDWAQWLPAFLYGLAPAGFLLLLAIVSRGGMGLGDVKLAIGLGLVLVPFGSNVMILGFALAFLFGGLWATGLLVTGKTKLRAHIPFGPFLLVGAWIALLFGGPILLVLQTAGLG